MEHEENESTATATQEMGTTERLFGPQAGEDEPPPAPPAEPREEKSPEPPKEAARQRDDSGKFVAAKPAESEKAPAPEYLSLEDFGEKRVKAKIGGEEKEITLKEALRAYQTDQYLTQKGQKIAEEYRQLQALKAGQGQPSAEAPTKAAEPDDEFYREYIKPHVEQQNKMIEALVGELNGLKSVTGPIQYQNNIAKLDASLKEQGYDDFAKYVPQIQEKILNMPVEQQMAYDSDWGFTSVYKDIKLAEYKEAMANGKKPETKLPDQRPTPKLVSVEAGGGAPSGADDNASILHAAFERAQKSGRMNDWAEVTRLKYGG